MTIRLQTNQIELFSVSDEHVSETADISRSKIENAQDFVSTRDTVQNSVLKPESFVSNLNMGQYRITDIGTSRHTFESMVTKGTLDSHFAAPFTGVMVEMALRTSENPSYVFVAETYLVIPDIMDAPPAITSLSGIEDNSIVYISMSLTPSIYSKPSQSGPLVVYDKNVGRFSAVTSSSYEDIFNFGYFDYSSGLSFSVSLSVDVAGGLSFYGTTPRELGLKFNSTLSIANTGELDIGSFGPNIMAPAIFGSGISIYNNEIQVIHNANLLSISGNLLKLNKVTGAKFADDAAGFNTLSGSIDWGRGVYKNDGLEEIEMDFNTSMFEVVGNSIKVAPESIVRNLLASDVIEDGLVFNINNQITFHEDNEVIKMPESTVIVSIQGYGYVIPPSPFGYLTKDEGIYWNQPALLENHTYKFNDVGVSLIEEIKQEVPVGSGVSYELVKFVYPDSESVFIDGLLKLPSWDYSVSGKDISLANPISTSIYVNYWGLDNDPNIPPVSPPESNNFQAFISIYGSPVTLPFVANNLDTGTTDLVTGSGIEFTHKNIRYVSYTYINSSTTDRQIFFYNCDLEHGYVYTPPDLGLSESEYRSGIAIPNDDDTDLNFFSLSNVLPSTSQFSIAFTTINLSTNVAGVPESFDPGLPEIDYSFFPSVFVNTYYNRAIVNDYTGQYFLFYPKSSSFQVFSYPVSGNFMIGGASGGHFIWFVEWGGEYLSRMSLGNLGVKIEFDSAPVISVPHDAGGPVDGVMIAYADTDLLYVTNSGSTTVMREIDVSDPDAPSVSATLTMSTTISPSYFAAPNNYYSPRLFFIKKVGAVRYFLLLQKNDFKVITAS